MVKKSKQSASPRKNRGGLNEVLSALDLVLAGHNTVIGSDFIITKNDPYNADIGHLDPKALHTFDQDFVDTLVCLKPKKMVAIHKDLKNLSKDYSRQRDSLSDYHIQASTFLFEHYDIIASKELGNFDRYLNKIVLRNEAEQCVFYDYIALYRKIGTKRSIVHWREQNPLAINQENNQVVSALEKATFAVLRLDQNLDYGGIKVTNVITQEEFILIDRALNASKKEGCFFICSVLNMGDYLMTSGGGTPIDPKASAGKSALTLLKKHLVKLQNAKRPVNQAISECVQEIYGFCLRGGALEYMTIS